MDVYARDEAGTVYNVEMQTTQQPADMLPKRSRYYQSQLDLVLLKPGEDFRNLPNSFVIFICTFDPFGQKSYRYTFLEQCQENGALLNDGSAKIFLNCEGKNVDEESLEVQDFLRYVKESLLMRRAGDPALVEDELLAGLETRMRELKKNRGLEDRYMLFEEMLAGERREGYEDGRAAGLTEGHAAGLTEGLTTGQDRMLALITAMTAAGEGQEIPRLSDEEFREVMYEKYKIV